ncbi:MAG TPA: tripartite tricarboxylate transporter substrate binding protein [Burkholderiales bacterium]|jgi:putative tricarboxylic transport membrane protein|nr:tripartite tricarboxylate transporter substrate binding protein [Burkholderiales bacterium]
MHRIVWMLLLLPAITMAQGPQAAWKPERPVELVIGAAPAGANDRIGRAIQRVLTESKIVSVPINAINKPGAGQTLAFAYLNTHPSNPHYLGLASSSWLTTIAAGRGSAGHKEFTPIVKILDEYQVYFVRADSPIKSARDIVEQLKKDPASLSFGFSTAAGNPLHLSIATLARQAGADPRKVKAVVFTTGTDTAIQVAGGHLDVGVQSPGSAQAMAEAGKIRIIAVGAPKRHPGALASVPTLREQGLEVDANVFYTVFGPRGLTAAQTAYWDQAISQAMQSGEITKNVAQNYWTIGLIGHRDLPQFLDREIENFRRVLSEMGLM